MKNGSINYKNRGFTLVEILIVMAIVAMLSTLAVNGYMTYRKNTLLDLSADNLISQILEMRSKTIYGTGSSDKFEEIKAKLDGESADGDGDAADGGANNSAKCYGVHFGKNDDDEFEVKGFEQDFNNKKIWKLDLQKWQYQGCDDFVPSVADQVLEEDSQVKILEVTDGNGGDLDSLVMRFFPPNGVLEISENDGQKFDSKFESGDLLKIKLQYGADDDPQYQRMIEFDPVNKTAVVNRFD